MTRRGALGRAADREGTEERRPGVLRRVGAPAEVVRGRETSDDLERGPDAPLGRALDAPLGLALGAVRFGVVLAADRERPTIPKNSSTSSVSSM